MTNQPAAPVERPYTDPERLMRAAIQRTESASAAWTEDAHSADVLELLEKAHYAIENAQRSIAAHHIEAAGSWHDLADATGSTVRQTRARFATRRGS